MGKAKANYKTGAIVLALVCLGTFYGCSASSSSSAPADEDPRGVKWGSVDNEPVVRDACRTLDDGSYTLPSRFHPEYMTFTSSLYRKHYSKNTVLWSVDVSIPRDGSTDAHTVCEVKLNRGTFVESVHLYDLPLER